jgi:hypothetical protein
MNVKNEAKRLLLDKKCENCFFGIFLESSRESIKCNFYSVPRLSGEYCENFLRGSKLFAELVHGIVNGPFNPDDIITTGVKK